MGKKITDLRMEPASNGVIISWCEQTPKSGGKNTYDNCSYAYPKEVFDFDGDNDIDKAFERFKELWKEQYADHGSMKAKSSIAEKY